MGLTSEMTMKTKKEQKVEIIIPTLNEESSIRELINSIRNYNCVVQNSILVIDGGSTDKTVEICNEENVTILQQRRKGKGSAMREAVDATDADVIVFIDGDGTYSINDLNSLLEPVLSDKADMVVGSRVLGDREKGSISKFNYIGNKLFNKTINFSLKSKVTDSLSGYRVLRREVFRDLILFSDSFEIEVEMTVEALAKGYRVQEIPIKYGKRKESQTKLNPLSDGIKISKTLLFITMNVNPIKFFGLITVGFFLIGLIPISQILYEKIILGNIISVPSVILATLLFVTGIMSLVIGLVSELVVRSRRRLEYLINHKN
jgi:dolichol-phosphate mannosyltransferase